MCGIAGFIGRGNEDDLLRMIRQLRHRGPDFQGGWWQPGVGLGHARLSIIDLSDAANQPFFTADQTIGMVFNGEIYNFQELRNDLLKLNKYTLRTTSDTEVLVYMYEEYGEAMFDRINGMFAFVIHDFKRKRTLIARDRMGKKPLYYSVAGDTLVYGSEPKALLQHPLVSNEISPDAINAYLTFEYVPTPYSIFRDIHKLEPGQYMIFEEGRITKHQPYWNVTFNHQPISFESAIDRFDALLNDATAIRMIADVPLGIFLSGGLDSSAVAYYAQKNSAVPIKTFSIGFQEKSYDEAGYARTVAKHLGTDHHEKTLTAQDSLDLLPNITDKLDEPFADASIIPTYLLSQFTREQVTVSLGGDGSDELLAGYPTFTSDYARGVYSKMPRFVHALAGHAADLLPVKDDNISLDFKVKQFLKGFQEKPAYTHTLWLGSFSPSQKRQLLSSSVLSQVTDKTGLGLIDKHLAQLPANTDSFDQTSYIYYQTYLLDDILTKVDRASMYNSLEVRAPFLDYRIVDFANSLPESYKRKGLSGKYILKSLMRGKIPDDIIDRPKKGFGIPLSQWLRNELRPLCDDLLSEASLKQHGLFNYDYVAKIKNEHYAGKQNNRKLLWTLMVFQQWYRHYVA
ncbi:asparagine synthase (glutamine-hydrolyzing) [Spirosoma sp. BT702]|uniref:asparagine synthase (glutamine-hydrolyzing) n=1 Tax=Spirosoma profusum TaxID=2771354 RepID=A0A926XTJ0_9BACT|nr:asparagine synthase (glutamine-hydrolyzing) [Spirosoma profusum]MBD2700043.1 asparagine synthase (glutamine-hydrolyzing) [Spirosoma profusum]